MDGGHVIPDAIRELLEKRATFQEWLHRLDELGGEFRPDVAEKVRSDYSGRLAEVEGELEGHRAELEAALVDRTATVEELAARHDSRSAELEETRLRHAVGEFDDREWERRRAEHQSKIDDLTDRLTQQRAAVDYLETVLNELTASASAVAASISAEVEETEPPIPEELAESAGAWADDTSEAELTDTQLEHGEPWMTQPLDDAEAVEATLEEVVLEEVEGTVVEVEGTVVEVEPTVVEVEGEVIEVEADAGEAPGKEDLEAVAVDEPEEFMDELEFLESLSLDDAENFDAVSAMLDEEEADSESGEGTGRKTEDH